MRYIAVLIGGFMLSSPLIAVDVGTKRPPLPPESVIRKKALGSEKPGRMPGIHQQNAIWDKHHTGTGVSSQPSNRTKGK